MTFRLIEDPQSSPAASRPMKARKRGWVKIFLPILAILLIIGGFFGWKAGWTLNKISVEGNILKSIGKSLPGVEKTLEGEKDGRINILVLGMRGENVPGGGTLADTIMVLSLHIADQDVQGDQNRASLVSIPRDLYVKMPGREERRKINAVYALGRETSEEKALEDMKTVVSEVSGQPMHYVVTINFKGFTDLVNALGGITVTLKEPFIESQQFHEPQVCDTTVYTKPAIDPKTKLQMMQHKYYTRLDGTKYIAKSYPLCYNRQEECGGNFTLPAGESQLDGQKALCYARSRYTTSDFDRARRQQEVIEAIKHKALSLGTLSDFGKINEIFNSLGNNVRTDLEAWEMKRFFDLYLGSFKDVKPVTGVLDNSDGGLLYNPPQTPETGYILLPKGDNYDQVRALFRSILEPGAAPAPGQ